MKLPIFSRLYALERFLMMLGLRRRERGLLEQARGLYANLVCASRQPMLYVRCAVRDDLEGRYEMLGLHLFLVLERLRCEPGDTEDDVARLGDFLTEVAVSDLEQNLRQIGVGDLAVGRRVQEMTRRHYARLMMYRQLFEDDTAEAEEAESTLIDYVLSDARGVAPLDAPQGARRLARYIRDNLSSLAAQPLAEFVAAPCFTLLSAHSSDVMRGLEAAAEGQAGDKQDSGSNHD